MIHQGTACFRSDLSAVWMIHALREAEDLGILIEWDSLDWAPDRDGDAYPYVDIVWTDSDEENLDRWLGSGDVLEIWSIEETGERDDEDDDMDEVDG